MSTPVDQIKCWSGEDTAMWFSSSRRIWDVEDGPGSHRPWNKGCLFESGAERSRTDALSWIIREMYKRIRCVVVEAIKVVFMYGNRDVYGLKLIRQQPHCLPFYTVWGIDSGACMCLWHILPHPGNNSEKASTEKGLAKGSSVVVCTLQVWRSNSQHIYKSQLLRRLCTGAVSLCSTKVAGKLLLGQSGRMMATWV